VRALSIAWKDIRHVYRGVAGLVMMLVAPLLLAFVLSMAFGSGDTFSIAAVRTVVVNQDIGAGAGMPAAGATLAGVLTSPELKDLLTVTQAGTPEAAKATVDAGKADVAVIIPTDLTAALAASVGSPSAGAGSAAVVEIYKDPALTVGPSIVAAVVDKVIESLNGARAAAATSALLGVSRGLTDPAKLQALASGAAQSFSALAQQASPVTLQPRAPSINGAKPQATPNVGSQVLVGMMLFFMLFGAATPSRSILDEHREGTLPRLFTTPTPRSVILGGKYLSVFSVVLIQEVVLVVAGRLLFGTHWGEILPVAVLIVCGAFVATSLGLLTVSFAKTAAQAGAVSSAIFVFLALISGNFTGTIGLSGVYAVIRRFSPLGWLMEGWNSLLYGGSWSDIALPVIASLSFALAFFGMATFFFRRRYA
jgi:ABC-2 type transport system permease protein